MTDPWGDQPDTGLGTRRAVGAAAWLALGLALAGGALGLRGSWPDRQNLNVTALVVAAVAAAIAAGCLWHGSRNAHERGRGAAFAALFGGLLVVAMLLWPLMFLGGGRGRIRGVPLLGARDDGLRPAVSRITPPGP